MLRWNVSRGVSSEASRLPLRDDVEEGNQEDESERRKMRVDELPAGVGG
jgi:hypothetical protein